MPGCFLILPFVTTRYITIPTDGSPGMAPNVFELPKLGAAQFVRSTARSGAFNIPICAGFARSKKANVVSRLLRVQGPSTEAKAKPQRRSGAAICCYAPVPGGIQPSA